MLLPVLVGYKILIQAKANVNSLNNNSKQHE